MDWGRIGKGIITGGLSEVPGALGLDEKRTDNEFKDIDRGNFNLPGANDETHYDWMTGTFTTTPGRGTRLNQLADQAGGRDAPQSAGVTAADSSFRADQAGLVDRLRRQMSGEDSLSAMQLRQAADANIANQRSFAAGARPGSTAMTTRLAMQNMGRINQGLAGQQAMAGIAERNAAAGMMGGVLQGARGQDIGLNQFNAGQGQQNNQFNAGMQLQGRGQNDSREMGLRQLELQNAGMQQQGGQAFEQQRTNRFVGIAGEPTTGEKTLGLLQGGLQAGALMASDERAKTGIRPAPAQVDDLGRRLGRVERPEELQRERVPVSGGRRLDAIAGSLQPYEYSYKEPQRYGEGRRVGVMAQDVERAAPELVTETPEGVKHLDVPKTLGSALGIIGRLHERLNALEARG